jgi:GAF domain-containing protein
MLNSIRKFLSPPFFEGNEEKTRIAGLLNFVLLFIIIATCLASPLMIVSTEPINRLPLIILVLSFTLVELIAYGFMRRGQVNFASTIFLVSLGIAILSSYAVSAPGSTGAALSLTILVAFTTLLLDARAILRLIIFIIVFTVLVILAQNNGWIMPAFVVSTDPISIWITNSFTLVFMGLGLYLSSVSLKRALDSSLMSQTRLQKSNQELDELRRVLEQRVAERTTDLKKRADQLETVSNVARALTSVQDLNELLPDITRLVSDRFGFYHAGIFLVDEAMEFAVLRAANSEGGARMLNRQHRLRLDSNSIVGFVTSRNEPRVALDVGADSVYFNNPDLPDTRSELALPLRISGRVIGALDVQSVQANAFSEEDVATLTILADQVAIAIENARLFSESNAALSETERTFERYIKQEWGSFASQAKSTGYLFDGNRTLSIQPRGQQEKVKALAQTGRLSLEKASREITVPIKLRGQTVGFLEVSSKKGSRQWTRDELTLLEAAAERAALALENARLVESAQRRASRERAIGEISSRIGAVTNVDTIMQMAVEELGRKISGAMEVTIELGAADEHANS